MKSTFVAIAALLAQQAAAQNMLRFACSQLVVDRVDPIVNPGQLYTPHLHQIVGKYFPKMPFLFEASPERNFVKF